MKAGRQFQGLVEEAPTGRSRKPKGKANVLGIRPRKVLT